MDEATQQNATLVQESAVAAKVMQQQAAQLRELMSFSHLDGSRVNERAQGTPRQPAHTARYEHERLSKAA